MNESPPQDPRRRLRELLSIPERDRTDPQWDEIIELEITLAPGNRESDRPAVVVLMNNPTLRLYRRYQALRPSGARPLPVVAQISARLVRGRVVLARISGSRRPDPTPALTGRPMAVRLKREPHRSGMAGGRGARQKHQAKADPGRVLPVVPFPDRSGAAYRVAGCRGGLARAYCRYLAECCGWACGSGS